MAKNKKKKGIFLKLLVVLIILACLGVVGYFGYASYTEVSAIVKDVEGFSYEMPDDLTDQVDLPTQIGEKITIEWNSSNEKVFSNTGKVTQPDFEEDGANVTVTGKINVNVKQIFSKFILNMYKDKIQDLSYTVFIPAKLGTDEDKVNSVLNKLSLTEETFTSINLPSTLCYEGISISWDSLNDSIMSDSGKVTTPTNDTLITLRANVECGSYSDTKDFQILVLKEEKVLEVIDDNFDNQAKTSTYKTVKSPDGVIYHNARIFLEDEHAEDNETDMNDDLNALVPAFIRFRNDKEHDGYFEIPKIVNPKSFSFKYHFAGKQTTESSKFVITYATDKGEVIKEQSILHQEDYLLYSIDLSEYEFVSIKCAFVDEWSTDTFVDIDNVLVTTNASIDDLESWITNNTPTKVSKAVILPITTMYGGEITWTSDSSALTSNGVVTKQDEATKVTLTATITYLDETSTITIEVTVVGLKSSEALEIYFIDIGKYGAGDCGESIYIKFGNTDIIVDAGDNFDSTGQAVVEGIKQRMQDDKIEYVIATHPDADHIGGMPTLFDAFNIENLIKFEGGYHTKKYDKFVEAYTNEGCNVYDVGTDIVNKVLAKKFITISDDIYIDIVDTKYYVTEDEKGKPMESNGRSIVFVLNAYNTRVLFTGDADNAPNHPHLEQNYMNEVGDIDILKVVHHGTRNGCDLDYLDVINPEVAIICNGNYLGNKHGHPTPRAISNLYTHNPDMKVYAITGGGTIDGTPNKANGTYKCSSEDRFNQRNGLITITIDNNDYHISSEYFGDNLVEMKDTYYYKAIKEFGLA